MAVRADGPATGAARDGIDWEAVERSPEFGELVARRRRFVAPATVFFLACYAGFILLAGYAPEFMGRSVYEGFTVGYALALALFVMTWGLTWAYLRYADRVLDPLRERVASTARQQPTGRFDRQPADAPAHREEVTR
jgi:uncharacterized membrane protein (DUF485 family)